MTLSSYITNRKSQKIIRVTKAKNLLNKKKKKNLQQFTKKFTTIHLFLTV